MEMGTSWSFGSAGLLTFWRGKKEQVVQLQNREYNFIHPQRNPEKKIFNIGELFFWYYFKMKCIPREPKAPILSASSGSQGFLVSCHLHP